MNIKICRYSIAEGVNIKYFKHMPNKLRDTYELIGKKITQTKNQPQCLEGRRGMKEGKGRRGFSKKGKGRKSKCWVINYRALAGIDDRG